MSEIKQRLKHDEYGKGLLGELLGQRWTTCGNKRCVELNGMKAQLDGVVYGRDGIELAVEIESCVPKQVRGALLDLFLAHAPANMLVILKTPSTGMNDGRLKNHYTHVWEQLGQPSESLEVLVLSGLHGSDRDADLRQLRESLVRLRLL